MPQHYGQPPLQCVNDQIPGTKIWLLCKPAASGKTQPVSGGNIEEKCFAVQSANLEVLSFVLIQFKLPFNNGCKLKWEHLEQFFPLHRHFQTVVPCYMFTAAAKKGLSSMTETRVCDTKQDCWAGKKPCAPALSNLLVTSLLLSSARLKWGHCLCWQEVLVQLRRHFLWVNVEDSSGLHFLFLGMMSTGKHSWSWI